MFYTPARCSECGRLAYGTLERMDGIAVLAFDDDGSAEYQGWTDVDWETQKTVRNKQGLVTLVCPSGHQWQAEEKP